MVEFDDGAKRYAKANDIISQSYLEVNQNVLALTQDGYFERGVVKQLIKKKKSGKLGYIVEKDGKQKWYPLRFVSLTFEQAELLPVGKEPTEGIVFLLTNDFHRFVFVLIAFQYQHLLLFKENVNECQQHHNHQIKKQKVHFLHHLIKANDQVELLNKPFLSILLLLFCQLI